MNIGRLALVITCALVAALGVWFAAARWDDANRIATVASALGAVAAVGIAIWAAMRAPASEKSVTVSDTGRASTDHGGRAITGISGKADGLAGQLRAERTGDANASGGGDAVSGAQLD